MSDPVLQASEPPSGLEERRWNARIKHLEMIQAVIARMGQNSFIVKGWAVTLIAALVAAVATHGSDTKVVYAAPLPAIVFWSLDAFYLRQERRYRRLYERVRAGLLDGALFSMDATPTEDGRESFLCAFFSITVAGVHALAVLTTACLIAFVTR